MEKVYGNLLNLKIFMRDNIYIIKRMDMVFTSGEMVLNIKGILSIIH